jgi:antitoxin (DNA-binding transcriptional repressor) of toxin-antitoxin stability system
MLRNAMRFNPSVTEVARNFADYINRVAFRGERFVLMRGKKPVAELRPIASGRRLSELPDLLASLPSLGADEATALREDLERASGELNQESLQDLWEF